jgi:2-succinyl-6-hydroxy-2,4-cyclohexadiene-1-carboxylate synthase
MAEHLIRNFVPQSQLWPHITWGRPTNPPIVFLHGFLGAGLDWGEIASPLAEDYFCVCPDLPGHGANITRDFDAQLSIPQLALELRALCAALSLSAPIVVGYSLGGRVALAAAVQHPQFMRALMLESTSAGLDIEAERQARAATDDARAAVLLADGIAAFMRTWYAAPLFESLQMRPQLLAKLQAARTCNNARWMSKVVSELSPGRAASVWAELPSVRLRTLLLAGALDVRYTESAQRMCAAMPNAVCTVVADAGHNVHLEQPTAYIQALRDYSLQCN